MRFAVVKTSCGSERIGTLKGFVKSPSAAIETPSFGLFTQGGSVVHLTAEVLAKVFTNPQLLWMPLCNSLHLENGIKAQGEGVSKFIGLQDHVTCLTLNNTNEAIPPGHLEANKVPMWTKQGKKMICAERFMDVMEVFKPDIILAVADSSTSLSDGHKRLCKSVARTNSLLDKCVERYKGSSVLQNSALIGAVVAPGEEKKCNECIQHILTHREHIAGVCLTGITNGSQESYQLPLETLDGIFKRVGTSIPSEFLRMVEGCWDPPTIMSAIAHGWDVFDGSYTLKLTNAGKAFALNLDMERNSNEMCVLDLNDERYEDDFKPILCGCECLCCVKHTRAYIRHLLNTREMLASVLLAIHNLHHFNAMFITARHHITAGTLATYTQHINAQYTQYNAHKHTHTKHYRENDQKDKKEELGNSNRKKKKVSKENSVVNGS